MPTPYLARSFIPKAPVPSYGLFFTKFCIKTQFPMRTLRLILGDQLNADHSWFQDVHDDVWYVLMEMRQETDYVRHHVQKVVAFFKAMRAFAAAREAEGHQVIYYRLDHPNNRQSLPDNLQQLVKAYDFERFEYQLPDEYRLDAQLHSMDATLGIPCAAVDTEHFLTERQELAEMFAGKKTYLMETFYRNMRKRFDVMMTDEQTPLGGQWNYDADNRQAYDGAVPVPEPLSFDQDVSEIVDLLTAHGVETMGEIDPQHFLWPTTREEAEQALAFFLETCLPHFGRYQDALTQAHWSLFHARLSFPLNAKILHPLDVTRKTVAYWEAHQAEISLSQVEGFVRQVIGWREYMRGVYWAHMPDYASQNYFDHDRELPAWYWTGKTKMNCLHHAIGQSLDHAYAHHIQRLMITGNFALLAGISPDALDRWYLGIYIDAIEWVEITNTRGMSQYADGGLVGTKPYVSSANYIDKMSDYCKPCHYAKSKKHGDKACPFNSLYWHFYARNRDKLERNPRIGFVYPTLDKMKPDNRQALMDQAEAYLDNLDEL
jgi:deoxyribodipyrimidine photolyase-related protein